MWKPEYVIKWIERSRLQEAAKRPKLENIGSRGRGGDK
jgi:hypothetical protein